ncbi:dynamin family protein [Lonepinella sp. MS14436]|uniref:dynamin family protein n=1 Tax=Lonepinella sp. MS14436 TaxID=3003619 RepID=UPI0036DA319D
MQFQTQTQFLQYLSAVQQAIQPINLDQTDLDTLRQKIETAELIVPVIGGFSAGKSTLINSFLARNILPTNVKAETALATELRFSEREYIEAVNADESVQEFDLTDFERIKDNAAQYQYLRLYLNSQQLKEIQPLVLVDMPGFDAPIKTHNDAILSYLSKGVYFVFLTGVDEGTLSQSMIREIQKTREYGKDYAFALSKTNLRSASDVALVKAQISKQLFAEFGEEKDVYDFGNKSQENLQTILTAINPEKLFHKLFIDTLTSFANGLENSINTTKATYQTEQKDVEEAIQLIKDTVKNLKEKREKQIERIKREYRENDIQKIGQDVYFSLMEKKAEFVESAISNPETFKTEFNHIVKTRLTLSVDKYLKELGGKIISNIAEDLSNLTQHLQGFKIDDKFLMRQSEDMFRELTNVDISNCVNNTVSGGSIVARKSETDLDFSLILSTIIANLPVPNIVKTGLTFLSSLIFGGNSRDTEEARQREQEEINRRYQEQYQQEQLRLQKIEQRRQVEEKLNHFIVGIPSMVTTEIKPHIERAISQLVEKVTDYFSTELTKKEQEMETANKERDLANIQSQIMALDEALQQLQQLKQTYLSC